MGKEEKGTGRLKIKGSAGPWESGALAGGTPIVDGCVVGFVAEASCKTCVLFLLRGRSAGQRAGLREGARRGKRWTVLWWAGETEVVVEGVVAGGDVHYCVPLPCMR